MRVEVSITGLEMKKILLDHVQRKLGDVSITERDIEIEVKATQNYRSEWETGDFRAKLVRNGA